MTSYKKERVHALDSSRMILLLLGIPFHSAEMYRISGGWIIDAGQVSFLGTLFSAISHSFRLPGFFILAGFFAAMMLARKEPIEWLKNRFFRLVVPLIVTLLILGGWEQYWIHLANMNDQGKALESVFSTFPLNWINHRWFLIVLLVFCFAWSAIFSFSNKSCSWISRFLGFLENSPIIFMTSFSIVIALIAIALRLFLEDNLLAFYGIKIVENTPFFTLGILVFHINKFRDLFFSPSGFHILLSLVILSAYCLTYFAFYSVPPFSGKAMIAFKVSHIILSSLTGVFVSATFFGMMFKFFNKPSKISDYFVAGSLVIYLVHEASLLPLGYAFKAVSWNSEFEILLICFASVAVSVAFFEIIRRSNIFLLLFNGGQETPSLRVRSKRKFSL